MPLDGLEPLTGRPAAPAAEVVVWAIRLGARPADTARFHALLDRNEQARAARYRRAADRDRFVAGRAQLRQILGARLGIEAASIRFEETATGKPKLATGCGPGALSFNATGSGSVGLVAMQDGADVGIDVELLRTIPALASLATGILTPAERYEFEALPLSVRKRRFFDCWVRKEALAKAHGTGLHNGLDRFCLYPWPGSRTRYIHVAGDRKPRRLWVAPLPLPIRSHVGAIASTRAFDVPGVRWWREPAAVSAA